MSDVHFPCRVCGAQTCLARGLYELRREDGMDFFCPNGHSMHYTPGPTRDQKRITGLEAELRSVRRSLDRYDERETGWVAMVNALRNGAQVCPLGCGWHGTRRLTGWPPSEEDYRRFMDRAGGDLAEHLLNAHNATRAPIALLAEST